jgi:hypothetical protein
MKGEEIFGKEPLRNSLTLLFEINQENKGNWYVDAHKRGERQANPL